MPQYSVNNRNAQADAWETSIGASPRIFGYSGAPPANCAAGATGTKLIEWLLSADASAAAVAGAKSLSGLPISANAMTPGTIGYYRIMKSDGTTCEEQGTVSQTAAAWAPSTAVALNVVRKLNGNVYKVTTAGTTAGSGGPTGTGTGIADGTAVWAFQSAVGDIELDNPTVAETQPVAIQTWTKTWVGA